MTNEITINGADNPGLYERIFDEVSEAIIVTDLDGTIVLCNASVQNIFGWRPEELVGRHLETLIPARFHAVHARHMACFQQVEMTPRDMGKLNNTILGVQKDGREISLATTIARTRGGDGKTLNIAVVRDISERTLYLREIERLANTDTLTGLLNRRHFLDVVETMSRDTPGFWLGLFDLDGFKGVNAVYGQQVGDRLLVEVAQRIVRSLPEKAVVARMGSDEFAIVLPGPDSASDIAELGERISRFMSVPVSFEHSAHTVGMSAGFARFPDASATVGGLLERVEYSLLSTKRTRKGGVSIFSQSVELAIEHNASVERCLTTGDLEAELSLEFQPIVDLRTDQITHFEALARWNSPELGRVAPLTFIPVAERCGRINEMTEILFSKALLAAEAWPEQVSLSFNLSAQDILSRGSVLHLLRILLQSSVAPQRVEFEVTETSILTDFDQAEAALSALSGCGSRVALDDFGNGYSSYGYIDRLPLHKIKIDKSFLTRLNSSQKALKVIKGIADFAANLELDCVAEGIETRSDLERIRGTGVPFAQGYVLSRPVAEAAIPELLARGRNIVPRE